MLPGVENGRHGCHASHLRALMMISSGRSIPPWLKSITPSHLDIVYEVLGTRETQREAARLASKVSSIVSKDEANYTRNLLRFLMPNNDPDIRSHYSVAIAALPENLHYNRYMDIAPYDRTRVVVYQEPEEPEKGSERQSNYLNASWVLEWFGHKWWIATQAPLPNTAHTLLSLFLQPIQCPPKSLSSSLSQMSRLRTIVQLTQNYEGGRQKAHAYFPSDVGKSLIVSPGVGSSTSALKVTLLGKRSIKEAHCVHSTISIAPITLGPKSRGYDRFDEDDGEEGEPIKIQHMLYTAWPDHGIPEPEDREGLLAFLHLVDDTNRDISLASHVDDQDPDLNPPIVVGCSAGVGRTGSFIALSSLLRSHGILPPSTLPTPSSVLPRSPLGSLPRALKDDLVAQEIDSLREQRTGMVQRKEQIKLIYEILEAAIGLGTT